MESSKRAKNVLEENARLRAELRGEVAALQQLRYRSETSRHSRPSSPIGGNAFMSPLKTNPVGAIVGSTSKIHQRTHLADLQALDDELRVAMSEAAADRVKLRTEASLALINSRRAEYDIPPAVSQARFAELYAEITTHNPSIAVEQALRQDHTLLSPSDRRRAILNAETLSPSVYRRRNASPSANGKKEDVLSLSSISPKTKESPAFEHDRLIEWTERSKVSPPKRSPPPPSIASKENDREVPSTSGRSSPKISVSVPVNMPVDSKVSRVNSPVTMGEDVGDRGKQSPLEKVDIASKVSISGHSRAPIELDFTNIRDQSPVKSSSPVPKKKTSVERAVSPTIIVPVPNSQAIASQTLQKYQRAMSPHSSGTALGSPKGKLLPQRSSSNVASPSSSTRATPVPSLFSPISYRSGQENASTSVSGNATSSHHVISPPPLPLGGNPSSAGTIAITIDGTLRSVRQPGALKERLISRYVQSGPNASSNASPISAAKLTSRSAKSTRSQNTNVSGISPMKSISFVRSPAAQEPRSSTSTKTSANSRRLQAILSEKDEVAVSEFSKNQALLDDLYQRSEVQINLYPSTHTHEHSHHSMAIPGSSLIDVPSTASEQHTLAASNRRAASLSNPTTAALELAADPNYYKNYLKSHPIHVHSKKTASPHDTTVGSTIQSTPINSEITPTQGTATPSLTHSTNERSSPSITTLHDSTASESDSVSEVTPPAVKQLDFNPSINSHSSTVKLEVPAQPASVRPVLVNTGSKNSDEVTTPLLATRSALESPQGVSAGFSHSFGGESGSKPADVLYPTVESTIAGADAIQILRNSSLAAKTPSYVTAISDHAIRILSPPSKMTSSPIVKPFTSSRPSSRPSSGSSSPVASKSTSQESDVPQVLERNILRQDESADLLQGLRAVSALAKGSPVREETHKQGPSKSLLSIDIGRDVRMSDFPRSPSPQMSSLNRVLIGISQEHFVVDDPTLDRILSKYPSRAGSPRPTTTSISAPLTLPSHSSASPVTGSVAGFGPALKSGSVSRSAAESVPSSSSRGNSPLHVRTPAPQGNNAMSTSPAKTRLSAAAFAVLAATRPGSASSSKSRPSSPLPATSPLKSIQSSPMRVVSPSQEDAARLREKLARSTGSDNILEQEQEKTKEINQKLPILFMEEDDDDDDDTLIRVVDSSGRVQSPLVSLRTAKSTGLLTMKDKSHVAHSTHTLIQVAPPPPQQLNSPPSSSSITNAPRIRSHPVNYDGTIQNAGSSPSGGSEGLPSSHTSNINHVVTDPPHLRNRSNFLPPSINRLNSNFGTSGNISNQPSNLQITYPTDVKPLSESFSSNLANRRNSGAAAVLEPPSFNSVRADNGGVNISSSVTSVPPDNNNSSDNYSSSNNNNNNSSNNSKSARGSVNASPKVLGRGFRTTPSFVGAPQQLDPSFRQDNLAAKATNHPSNPAVDVGDDLAVRSSSPRLIERAIDFYRIVSSSSTNPSGTTDSKDGRNRVNDNSSYYYSSGPSFDNSNFQPNLDIDTFNPDDFLEKNKKVTPPSTGTDPLHRPTTTPLSTVPVSTARLLVLERAMSPQQVTSLHSTRNNITSSSKSFRALVPTRDPRLPHSLAAVGVSKKDLPRLLKK